MKDETRYIREKIEALRGSRYAELVRERAAIDTRALAAFRISAGILIIADLLLRLRNFDFFYTNRGVVPLELAREAAPEQAFSVYFLSGSPEFTAAMFLVTGLVAVALTAGYRTRLSTLVSFLLVISLDYRNVMVTSYADTLFRHLLFWGIFLPLGERWSLDSLWSDGAQRQEVVSLASFMILLQVVAMYFVNSIHKLYSPIWMDGTATPLILGRDSMTFLLGDYITQFPVLLKYGGFAWLLLLLFSWLMLALEDRYRSLYAAALMVFEFMMMVTVRIGAFPYVSVAGLMLFLHSGFWDRLEAHLPVSGSLAAFRDRLESQGDPLKGRGSFSIPHRNSLRRYLSVLASAIVVISAANMAVANLGTLNVIDDKKVPLQKEVTEVKKVFHVNEPSWTIFAPMNDVQEGYFVIAATTENGSLRDIYNERPLKFTRPSKNLNEVFPTYRHRFYMGSELRERGAAREYLQYLCRTWGRAGMRLDYLTTYHYIENVTMGTLNEPYNRSRDRKVYHAWDCGKGGVKKINEFSGHDFRMPRISREQLIIARRGG
ncbi:MAG: HTTM domain-containing protein [Candidatus Nanohaloarchaea archaeon]